MKKRLLGGALVVGILLLAFLLGNIVFRIVMTITSILGLKELLDIKYKKKNILVIKIIFQTHKTILKKYTILFQQHSLENRMEKLFIILTTMVMIADLTI